MAGIIAIAFIIVLIIILFLCSVFNPKFDTIVVRGKRRKIMWYNGKDGRDWIFV